MKEFLGKESYENVFKYIYDDKYVMPKPLELTIFHEDGRVERGGRFLSKEEIKEMLEEEDKRKNR